MKSEVNIECYFPLSPLFQRTREGSAPSGYFEPLQIQHAPKIFQPRRKRETRVNGYRMKWRLGSSLPSKGAQPPRFTRSPDHPIARRSPRSRDVKAALTRSPMRGEVGADFCLLGMRAQ